MESERKFGGQKDPNERSNEIECSLFLCDFKEKKVIFHCLVTTSVISKKKMQLDASQCHEWGREIVRQMVMNIHEGGKRFASLFHQIRPIKTERRPGILISTAKFPRTTPNECCDSPRTCHRPRKGCWVRQINFVQFENFRKFSHFDKGTDLTAGCQLNQCFSQIFVVPGIAE